MRNLKFFVFGLITAVAAIGFGIAIGQSSVPILGNAQVQISQEIPIVADLLVPTEGGETITTTVPLTIGVNLQVSLSGATVTNIETVAKPTPAPTVQVRDAQNVPGMVGVDALDIPYKLSAPTGLLLDKWEVKETDDGGINYKFQVSSPNMKFDSDLQSRVTYYDSDDNEIGGYGMFYIGSMSGQDRDARSYKNDFDCDWGKCAGVLEKAKYYVITFEVDLIDFP